MKIRDSIKVNGNIEDVAAIILDVEEYPNFIPFYDNITLREARDFAATADCRVKFMIIKDSYASIISAEAKCGSDLMSMKFCDSKLNVRDDDGECCDDDLCIYEASNIMYKKGVSAFIDKLKVYRAKTIEGEEDRVVERDDESKEARLILTISVKSNSNKIFSYFDVRWSLEQDMDSKLDDIDIVLECSCLFRSKIYQALFSRVVKSLIDGVKRAFYEKFSKLI